MQTFRSRILLILLGLVIATQLATVSAFVVRSKSAAEQRAREGLVSAGHVMDALLNSRAQQLQDGVRVLASDYGFKDAATFGDKPTILSALQNVTQRIGADMATLVDLEGAVIASTNSQLSDARHLQLLLLHDGIAEATLTYESLQGNLYMLVASPVRAPAAIGYVIVGFEVNQRLVADLSRLLGASVSFYDKHDREAGTLVTTLDAIPAIRTREFLQGAGLRADAPVEVVADGVSYMTLTQDVPHSEGGILAVLQQPLQTALAAYGESQGIVLLIGFLAIALAIPVAQWLSRQASRPIEELVAVARRIEAGDYNEIVHLNGAAEFGRVATTINSMQQRVAQREQQIRHLATHDVLTGLPNRLMALEWIAKTVAEAPWSRSLPLMLIEIQDFARIQASLGHVASDKLLFDVCKRLQMNVGDEDFLAHVSPAQFLVACRTLGRDLAEEFGYQLVESLRVGLLVDDLPVCLDARVGICFYPDHAENAPDLLRRLDTALHDGLDANKSVFLYRQGLQADQKRQLALLADLRQSIKENQLTVHYQPKVGMRSHEVLGLEALVRWCHPVHGQVSPAEFIPLLERTGSIWLLTGWVIRSVVHQMAEWRKQGFEPDVSINLSSSDLLEPRMPEVIARALQASGVSPAKLVLEITESALMHEPEQAIRTMERLRKDSFRFSVDDFGTGYSSLSQFKRLPVDEIKIDRSFVQAMTAGSDDALIVKATIDLGHSFGVKVVAEGIETPECWRLLLDMGCDYAQGYLISKPLPAGAVMEYIRSLNGKLELAESPTVQIKALLDQAASVSQALRNA